jgi:hypothetical protein
MAVPVGGAILLANHFLLFGHTNRFRLTIKVETPEGVKSGSSVIQTWFDKGICWAAPREACNLRAEARGEAVFVDLGHGKNVVAILGWGPLGQDQDKIYELTSAALAPGRRVSWEDEYKLKGKGELPAEYVPTLVTFSDVNDPKTARVVRPDEFEQVFGKGVRFLGAEIQTTYEPITTGLKEKLPLLVSHADWMRHAYSNPAMFVPQYHLFVRS